MDPNLGTTPLAARALAGPRDPDEAAPGRELAEAHERVALLEARLASEARARAELVNLVSHELRTPITVISGFARLLQNEVPGALNEEQHRFVGESLRACRRLDEFVGDLLEARPGADTPFTVAASENDLHATIEAQLESLAPLLDERGLKVEAMLRCDGPSFCFDARRIEQVVTNLMTNAIRHARRAGIIRLATESVEVEVEAQAPGRIGRVTRVVRVSVEDDGPGIAEADRERIFAPYVRGAHEVDASGATGHAEASRLGIGLAICQRIIDAHGGCIRVESGALGGARFVFELPHDGAASGGD